MTLSGKRVLLIIGGGIAAYKCLDLIRRLRERGASVRCIMTRAAQQFVTPLSVGALSADHAFTELFDRRMSTMSATFACPAKRICLWLRRPPPT